MEKKYRDKLVESQNTTFEVEDVAIWDGST